jgi:hypothetical protein
MEGGRMIGIIFTLSMGLVLMLQLAATDAISFIRQTARDMDTVVGHDTHVFPDAITLHLPTIYTR